MKKSQLQQIIREEIQNALTEAIMVGWNGYEQKPIKIEPTREKDGINITNEDNPGQMWFVPSDQIPELVGYLQGLNLQPFTTGDAELNPSLVGMVNKLKKQKSLSEEVHKALKEDLQFLKPHGSDSTYLKQSKRALLNTLKNLQSVYKINNQDIQALADVIDEFADAYADDRIDNEEQAL